MKKVSLMYGVLKLMAIADQMEAHHWQNFKRGYPQYQEIKNEVNKILKSAADKKLTGLDEVVEID